MYIYIYIVINFTEYYINTFHNIIIFYFKLGHKKNEFHKNILKTVEKVLEQKKFK